MPSRQDSLRRMRFDEMLKKKDPEMYERYQKERLDNIKRKKSFKGENFKEGGMNNSKKMREASKRQKLKQLAKESAPILEPETKKMIEDFKNDRSPKFDRRMYDQSPEMGGDVKGMMKGGMTSCPNRQDGIRGGGAAIKGMKFTGVK